MYTINVYSNGKLKYFHHATIQALDKKLATLVVAMAMHYVIGLYNHIQLDVKKIMVYACWYTYEGNYLSVAI